MNNQPIIRSIEPIQGQVEHKDATATQGFEKLENNVIPVWPGDCQKCLLPFNRKFAQSWQVKVWTANGFEDWCHECAERGVKSGICVKYRSLSKKERQQLNKYAKQQARQAFRTE